MSNKASFQHTVARFVRQHALLHEDGMYLVASLAVQTVLRCSLSFRIWAIG